MTTSTPTLKMNEVKSDLVTFKKTSPNLFDLLSLKIVHGGKSEINSLNGKICYKVARKLKYTLKKIIL